MKFPIKVAEGTLEFPDTPFCPICGKRFGEAHGFIRLTTGAILFRSKKRDCGGPDHLMDTVFKLWYHGPHPSVQHEDGTIELTSVDNAEYKMDIVEPLQGGQVDIHVCSVDCLEAFFKNVTNAFRQQVTQADDEFIARNSCE